MSDLEQHLTALRDALQSVNDDATEDHATSAAVAATSELQGAAAIVARFANQLDDGVGFFNSSSTFGEQLARELSDDGRLTIAMGLLRTLDLDQALTAIQHTMLHLQVRIGPQSTSRPYLNAQQRAALTFIRDTAARTLDDAQLPNDPED